MDATRNMKIITASRNAWMEAATNCTGDPMDAACFAAVRAAYEIDGVRELLAAVDVVLNANGFNPTNESELEYGLYCAASRVREAMGGGE